MFANCYKLKFHGTVFRVASSQSCHEDVTRKTASVEFKLYTPSTVHYSYPVVGSPGCGGGGEVEQANVDTVGPARRNSAASIASLRLLAKEHELQTMFDVRHEPSTFLR